jgi:predicted DNA-binding ribbon-helix-helix protein
MKSPVVKRSIVINGHKTGVSVEDLFLDGGKKDSSGAAALSLSELVAVVDHDRGEVGNL